MLSVPIILLIVAAVVGIVGIAFVITAVVKRRHTHAVETVEKPRWGEELGFSYAVEAVDAVIAQWSHGAAVDGGLSKPSDPAVGEFAGHPAIVFGQDDGLIVAVQRDTATDVVVEIHPQEPATPEDALTAGRATDLQVYSSDVDAMIRATDDRLVELLSKHPQDLAMSWSEGYWSAALLPLGDDGVDVTPSNDQTINEQLPYVLNWLANLNDALKVLPPRAGEEEELALEGGGPSRPLVDRSDANSVPVDADPIEPEESDFFVEESTENSDIDTTAGAGLVGTGAAGVGITGINNVIPFVPFGGKEDIDDEDAVSQEELDAAVDDIALPEADEPAAADELNESDELDEIDELDELDADLALGSDLEAFLESDADDQENGLRFTEEASEYLQALEEAEAMDAAEDLEWVDHSDDVADVEPDHVDEETFTADWGSDILVEPADLSEDGDISAKDDYVTEADFLIADELQPDPDLVDEDAVEDTPVSPVPFVRPVASPEETGPLPVIKAQEIYYPSQEEPVSDDVPVDENGQHDFIVDIPEPEPVDEPAVELDVELDVEPETEPETESTGGSHVATDEREATMRTGEFPIIRPREEGAGARHVLDEGERPDWFVPGKTARRSRLVRDDNDE